MEREICHAENHGEESVSRMRLAGLGKACLPASTVTGVCHTPSTNLSRLIAETTTNYCTVQLNRVYVLVIALSRLLGDAVSGTETFWKGFDCLHVTSYRHLKNVKCYFALHQASLKMPACIS